MVQMIKNLPAVWKTWVHSLCCEDPLEKGMATAVAFLPGESMDRGAQQAAVYRVTKSQTQLSD